MASFEFSLHNGLPLILTAGGTGPTSTVFVANRDDVVFSVNGDYSMSINGSNVSITLTNMRTLIFPDKANYSAWFYYNTRWAINHNNCVNIRLDIALTRQGHGGWSDSNSNWKYASGYKGGSGNSWVKYRYNNVEADCSGYSGDGIYHGSARTPNPMTFDLGAVDFSTYNGFWIGANLDCWDGGYEVWQYVEFPMIVFEAPTITTSFDHIDICNKLAYIGADLSSSNSLAASGGTWELQYSTSSDFSNAISVFKTTSTGSVSFQDVEFAANSTYYVRGRIKVSEIYYSNWTSTSTISTSSYIPSADAVAMDISELECYKLKHGVLITGGVNGL